MIEKLAIAILSGIIFVLVFFALSLPLAVVLAWAWNGSITTIFGLPELGFWPAWKLMLVATLLIKSISTSSK